MPDDWSPSSPDPDDDPFLRVAYVGRAEYIISSDKRHMVLLENYKNIPIGNPKSFFKWVKEKHPMTS